MRPDEKEIFDAGALTLAIRNKQGEQCSPCLLFSLFGYQLRQGVAGKPCQHFPGGMASPWGNDAVVFADDAVNGWRHMVDGGIVDTGFVHIGINVVAVDGRQVGQARAKPRYQYQTSDALRALLRKIMQQADIAQAVSNKHIA